MLFATATASLSLLLQPLSAGWVQPAALPAGRSPPLCADDAGGNMTQELVERRRRRRGPSPWPCGIRGFDDGRVWLVWADQS